LRHYTINTIAQQAREVPAVIKARGLHCANTPADRVAVPGI